MIRLHITLLLVIWSLVSNIAIGSTIIPPADYGEMVRLSDAVIKVEIGDSAPIEYGGLVYTRVLVTVLHVFKGDFRSADPIHVFYLGGIINDQAAVVPGGATLQKGDVMILSLRKTGPGWNLWLLGYGQLRLNQLPDGTEVYSPLDKAHEIEYDLGSRDHVEIPGIYRKSLLEDHLSALLDGDELWDSRAAGVLQLVANEALTSKVGSNGIVLPAGCSMLDANGTYGRWQTLDGSGSVRVFTQNEATATDREAIQQAVNNWGSIAGTSLSKVQYGGPKSLPQCDASGIVNPVRSLLADNELFIAYNDPCGNLEPAPNCVGILATAQHYVSSQRHQHRGGEWANMTKGVIVVNKGIQSCLSAARFQQTIQHEIGHLLGFGHHTIEPANMNAACCNPLTAKDVACAQFVYSNMPLNPTPAIARIVPDVVPQGVTVVVSIEGAGFMPESVVAIGGADVQIQQTRYVHENRMEVTVVILRSAIPSSRAFRVTNPAPGGGRSQDMAFTVTASTAIPERDENGVPYTFNLGDNFPNPFNPSTVIPFETPWQTWVTLSLVDASGRTLRTLVDREMPAGRHRYELQADDMPSGLYIVRLTAENVRLTKKISLIK